jgi:hypothetical protein
MQAYASFNLKVAELRQDNDKTTTLSPQTPCNIEAVLSLLHRAQDLERSTESGTPRSPGTGNQTHLLGWIGVIWA